MRAIPNLVVAVLALAAGPHARAAPREAPEHRLCPEDAPEGVRLPPREGCAGAAASSRATRAPADGFRDLDGVKVRIGGRVGVDAGIGADRRAGMFLAIGLLILAGLWWLGRYGWRFPLRLQPRRLAPYAVLAVAVVLALRGRIELGILAAALALWLLEGRSGLARIASRWDPRAALRARTGPIAWTPSGTGVPQDGRVRAGLHAGVSLSRLSRGDLLGLLAVCQARNPADAHRLETYLDGRHPGWRVDAQGDGDARARGPLQPGAMSQEEAYEVLGLERGATLEEVRAAHRILMKRLHPDQGGSVERAARVNAARDRLMSRHR